MSASQAVPTDNHIKPVVKWVGGKTGLLPTLLANLPHDIKQRRVVEPFAGGAALTLALQPSIYVLNDNNADLINTYKILRSDTTSVIFALENMLTNHNEFYYYKIRQLYNANYFTNILRAAAFLYLNKTCFNGVYRVNASGEFNVPIGDQRPKLDTDGLHSFARFLLRGILTIGPFESLLDRIYPTDFVYFDPPYLQTFSSYTKESFWLQEHQHLAAFFALLSARGCRCMLSNSLAAQHLYKDWNVQVVDSKSAVAARGKSRGATSEILVTNY